MPMNQNKIASVIRKTLNRIGAINDEHVELLKSGTRDNPSLNVWCDTVSNVIFIDDYYVGDMEYTSGRYRTPSDGLLSSDDQSYEDDTDSERRFHSYRNLITGKSICDFGCGAGSFLKRAQSVTKNLFGVELQKNYADILNNLGIRCVHSIEDIEENLDVVTMFHCLEHLPDPTLALKNLYSRLKDRGGILIVEVPHACDFLISNLKLNEFIDFTLWSQHLVLHTRESLRLLLVDAGFKNIVINGVQRYNIANHFHWLASKKAGGHKSLLSAIETPELKVAYENALARINATDTLVAIATT